MKRFLMTALLAGVGLAQANTVFSDNFDSNAGGLNLVPAGWTVSSGTVDIIGLGTYWNWFPASQGKYIDLDGSTSQAGLLSRSFSMVAGTTYTVSFDLAGNQRIANADTVDVVFGSNSASYTLNQNEGFATRSLAFTASNNGTFTLSFHNRGGDNVGALLDNVTITAAVPEPETYALMLLGIGLVAGVVRHRKHP